MSLLKNIKESIKKEYCNALLCGKFDVFVWDEEGFLQKIL